MNNQTNKKRQRTHRRKPASLRKPGVANAGGWGECDVCGQHLPLFFETGMCGPCTTGDASTLFGDL